MRLRLAPVRARARVRPHSRLAMLVLLRVVATHQQAPRLLCLATIPSLPADFLAAPHPPPTLLQPQLPLGLVCSAERAQQPHQQEVYLETSLRHPRQVLLPKLLEECSATQLLNQHRVFLVVVLALHLLLATVSLVRTMRLSLQAQRQPQQLLRLVSSPALATLYSETILAARLPLHLLLSPRRLQQSPCFH